MFFNSVLTILFRLINFAVLMGLGYYLFKKYAKTKIDEKITQKEALLKGLEEQGYFLEGKINNLEERHHEREVNATVLKQKVDEWKTYVLAEQHKRQEEQRLFSTHSAQRIALKNDIIAQQHYRLALAPIVINDVQNSLQEQFSDRAFAKGYMQDIMHRLERK